MRVCWMLVILLGCRLSRTRSQCPCNCNAPPKIHSVPANGSLFVPCPNMTEHEDVKFDLHRDQGPIYSCHSKKCTERPNRTDVKLDINEQNQLVGFIIPGDAVRNPTAYRCVGTFTYPPPLRYAYSEWQVAVMEAQNCTCKKDNNETPSKPGTKLERTDWFLWAWITAVVLLSAYGLIVTIFAVVIWFKLNTAENQSDYMNTKPRPSRERRKKGGIQNPVPRYV